MLNRLKAGYSGLEHEAEGLYSRLVHFSLDPREDIDWDRREKEFEAIHNITFNEMSTFYKSLFNPTPESAYHKSV